MSPSRSSSRVIVKKEIDISMNTYKTCKEVVQKLCSQGWTLGLAESCTGGLISSQLTQVAGVSQVYNGGVVSYSNFAKMTILGVPSEDLESYGAVSKEVALKMAQGIKKILKSDVGLSVTGLAGPTGGTKKKPIGLVFIAVVGPNFEKLERHVFTSFNGEPLNRQDIQLKTSQKAWELLKPFL